MNIHLTRSRSISADWRNNHLIHIESGALRVEVPKDHPYYLREIQKAGRLVDQMGVLKGHLQGDWTLEEQWAFYQGFTRPKHAGTLEFAALSATEKIRLDHWISLSGWIRHWVNLGPDACTPLILADAAEHLIRSYATEGYDIEVSSYTGEALLEQGFVGCHAVGKGSSNPPVLRSIKVFPHTSKSRTIKAALIGKGITFDSGGYVIKPRESIGYMKVDMGGAATITAALALSMSEGLAHPVELILCCAENLVSSTAYRPGDVIHYKNGLTVEVINTDAEGRLVLADGFLKAAESKPALIIDAATLTGAAIVAVGTDYSALFTRDPALRARVLGYAAEQHEGLWPLPVEAWHQEAVPSMIADTANAYNGASASPGNASIAAGFLNRFVEPQQKWLHFDLASVYQERAGALWGGGATASMLRTLAYTLQKEIS